MLKKKSNCFIYSLRTFFIFIKCYNTDTVFHGSDLKGPQSTLALSKLREIGNVSNGNEAQNPLVSWSSFNLQWIFIQTGHC